MKTVFLLAAAIAAPALAADPGQAAIEALGRVNGIALACGQPTIVSHVRNLIVARVPKSRNFGEAFESSTNAAFLEQGKQAACPQAAALNQALADAEHQLQAAFPAKP